MLLKKLYDNNYINIESILVKNYKSLGLSSQESMVLLSLLNDLSKKNTFSMTKLSKHLDYSSKDIGMLIDSLIDKGFLTIYLEHRENKKSREVYHLDDLFFKLEHLLQEIEVKKTSTDEQLTKVIVKLEQYMNRLLSPNELEALRQLFDVDKYNYEDVYQLIEQLKDQVTIKKLQRLLVLQDKLPQQSVDPETDKALDALYKSIK